MNRMLSCTIAAICFLLAATPSQADLAAVSFDVTTSTGARSVNNQTLGYAFSVNADIFVTRLGFFDLDRDGLGSSHDVGIFDDQNRLLISTTVTAGTTATLDGDFRYVDVQSVKLIAGHNYSIGGTVGAGGPDFIISQASKLATPSEVTYIGGRFQLGAALQAPISSLPEKGYFGPNFEFRAVPEPSSLLLTSIGISGLIGWVRTRRRRA